MNKRSGGEKQEDMWIAYTELTRAPGHPFYERLNELLEQAGFDAFVEGRGSTLLSCAAGTAIADAWGVLPFTADWIFRRHRGGAWERH